MSWTSEVGPRITKAIEKSLRDLRAEARTRVELTCVVGQPEGPYDRCTLLEPFSQTVHNPTAVAELQALEVKYGSRITEANRGELEKDLEAALARSKATRPVVDKRRTQEADEAQRSKETMEDRKRAEAQSAKDAKIAAIMAKKPAWAKALIMAELERDACDSMTDYYATTTERVVAIGWRRGEREDFRQLRQAAAGFPETAHLGPDAPKEVEHRDNYSMGTGNYLKASGHYSTGWRVYSREKPYGDIEDALPSLPAERSPSLPTEIPPDLPERDATIGTIVSVGIRRPDGVVLRESSHRPDYMEIVYPEKPNAECREALKAAGFRWSPTNKCWYGPRETLPAGVMAS